MWVSPPSLCFTLAALTAVRCTAGDETSWSYGNVLDWTKVPDSTCTKEQQSPIDVISLHAKGDDSLHVLQYNNQPSCRTAYLQSDGSTWVVKYKDYETCGFEMHVTFKERKYYAKQVQFHTPSEHSVDGMFFDMEAQVVHEDWEGNTLIIAILMQVNGQENGFLKRITPGMPSEVGESMYTAVASLNPYRTLFPPLGSRHYYTYNGSTTAPPCDTGVQWIVFDTPIGLAMEQRTEYRAAVSNVKDTKCAVGAAPPVGVTLPWPRMIGSNNRPIQAYGAQHQLYHWPAPWKFGPPKDLEEAMDALQGLNELSKEGVRFRKNDRASPSTPYVLAGLGSAVVLGFSVGRRLRRICSESESVE